MNSYRIIGLVLIAAGAAALIYGGITYTTTERVIDIGPIHATREKQHTSPLPPVVGTLMLLAGTAVLLTKKG